MIEQVLLACPKFGLAGQGILTGIDGPHENVIKVRPPMPFNKADAKRLLEVLEEVLGEGGAGRDLNR